MSEFDNLPLVIQDYWETAKGVDIAITDRTRDRYVIHGLFCTSWVGVAGGFVMFHSTLNQSK